jgi:hypothetical protein
MVQPKSKRVAFQQYVDDQIAAAVQAAVANYVQTTTLTTYQGQVSNSLLGKASLVNGLIPTSQIPAIAITGRVTVADQTAMLALTDAQVQPGDVAVWSNGNAYMLAGSPVSSISSWVALNSGTGSGSGAVASVNGQVGTVVLGKGDVGLGNVDNTSDVNKPVSTAQQTALDKKADKTTTDTLATGLNNRYTKAESDAQIGSKVGVVLIPNGAAIPEGLAAGTLVIERKA